MIGTPRSFDLVDHVGAEALRVGQRRTGLVDAGVDGAAEMLEEGSEEAAIESRIDRAPD